MHEGLWQGVNVFVEVWEEGPLWMTGLGEGHMKRVLGC